MNKLTLLFLSLALFYCSNISAQKAPEGRWDGTIALPQFKLAIIVHFKTEKDTLKAIIDIPQQRAKGLTLKNVVYKAPELSFDLESPVGLAKFKGTNKDTIIDGSFEQGALQSTFYLKPYVPEKEEVVTYKQEEITFKNKEIKLTGTLTLPENAKGPVPAVILITGSGTQNRDEQIFDFKPFKVIANHFTKNGIAVLRYDDRGAGGSTGNGCDATSADFAKDVEEAFKYLQKRPEINAKKIGLMGHSEGGAIAPMVAVNNKNIAFIISMAGTGVSGEEIIMEQVRSANVEAKLGQTIIDANLAEEKKILEAVRLNTGTEKIKADMLSQTITALKGNEQYRNKTNEEIAKDAQEIVDSQMKPLDCAWFKYFVGYDPSTQFKKVKCPVLGLFGGLDTQVPVNMNNKAIKNALHEGGNDNYTSHIFNNANHLFIAAKTGNTDEYATLPKVFVEGFLDTCTGWIWKQAK